MSSLRRSKRKRAERDRTSDITDELRQATAWGEDMGEIEELLNRVQWNKRSSIMSDSGSKFHPLHCAVIENRLNLLRFLVETYGADCHDVEYTPGSKTTSALAWAISWHSSYEIVQYLIQGPFREHLNDILPSSDTGSPGFGKPALVYALERDNLMAVRALLDAGAAVNVRVALPRASRSDPLDWTTILHRAIYKLGRKTSLEGIQLLLQHGANVNALDSSNMTAMERALYHSFVSLADDSQVLQLFDLLEEYGANYDRVIHEKPVSLKHVPVPALRMRLLVRGAPSDVPDGLQTTLLHDLDSFLHQIRDKWPSTARQRFVDLVIQQASRIDRTNRNGNTALHMVACAPFFEEQLYYTTSLLAAGATLQARNNRGEVPLHLARQEGMIRALATDSWDLTDWRGRTPLHLACAETTAVRTMLELGAPVDVADDMGWTPLFYAVLQGNVEAVERLLQHGASINCEDLCGRTALHVVASAVMMNWRTYFLSHGETGEMKEIPLDLPIVTLRMEEEVPEPAKCTRMVRLLQSQGANITGYDSFDTMPFIYAATTDKPTEMIYEMVRQVAGQGLFGNIRMNADRFRS